MSNIEHDRGDPDFRDGERRVLRDEYCWRRMQRDLSNYLRGGLDNELQNRMMARYYGISPSTVGEIWAEARAERARREGLAS